MPFTGFTDETLTYYDGLLLDNSKTYHTTHKELYERAVRIPMEEMLAELAKEFGGTAHVYRPHRDVRFSPDKSPYKTHAGGLLQDRTDGAGLLYVQVSSDGLMAATGYYQMAPDQIARFRQVLSTDDKAAENGEELLYLIEAARASGLEVGGEQLKTVPRGIARDHVNADLLRYKSLTAAGTLSPQELTHERTALMYTAHIWRTAIPLLRWLDAHVGASTLPPRQAGV